MIREIVVDGTTDPVGLEPSSVVQKTPLEARRGIVYDPKMTAPLLKAVLRSGRVLLRPDKEGDIRCYNGVIDITGVLQKCNRKYTRIYHRDDIGIVIELARRD